MNRHSISIWFAAVVFALAILVQLAGCSRGETATPTAAMAPPAVSVATVLSRQIADFDEFTGRFEAVERVEIRPRVSGYIYIIVPIYFTIAHSIFGRKERQLE